LPVYDKPVIYYAIEKLVAAGVDRIMIVTSPHHLDGFVRLLGSGQDFISINNGKQIQIVYGIQNEPSGIADGLYIAKDYIGTDNCILYLGDNIFEDDIKKYVKGFKDGALVFLKKVRDPERFAVARVDKNGKVLEIKEKPRNPTSNMAVVGLYMYDNTVFKKMVGQPKSKRGEYEITYVNNKYIKEGKLKAAVLKKDWFDVGTFDSLLKASDFKKNKSRKSK
jgi:glucose-1-phosphate thymidylyltransferase